MKQENARLRATLGSSPMSASFSDAATPTTSATRTAQATDPVGARVLQASREVARAKLLPPAQRPDLDIHKQGRKIVQKIKSADVASVTSLLESNPDLLTMRAGTNGYTLLHIAAGSGATEVVNVLLENFPQLDPLATDLFGRTALHVAADMLHSDICNLFLEKLTGMEQQSLVGENAPQDIVGLTPAGCSALKHVRKEGDRYKRRQCTDLLHEAGDACISPMPQKLPKRKTFVVNRNASASRRSSLFKETVIRPGFESGAGRSSGDAGVGVGHASMPGFRVTMEDAVCLAPNVEVGRGQSVSVFAVFDGHGGRGAAEYCAENLIRAFTDQPGAVSGNIVMDVDELQRCLKNTCWQLEEELRVSDAFILQETVIREAMGNEPAQVEVKAKDNSGTTGLIAVLCGSYIAVANVGDCRAVLSTMGNVIQLSRDHKPMVSPLSDVDTSVQRPTGFAKEAALEEAEAFYASEKARIEKAGGGITEDSYVVWNCTKPKEKLAMTRSIGDFQYKQNKSLPREEQAISAEPEIIVYPWEGKEGDFLVLACDGVWDVITNEAVAGFVRRSMAGQDRIDAALDETCHKLLLECLKLHSEDNMTVVLLDLERHQHTQPHAYVENGNNLMQSNNSLDDVSRDLFAGHAPQEEEEEDVQDLI